ncbi:PREDICTED: uncharacterized protein LOC108359149 [Rhagoletis zephyria]|uniref:uncharacterized protein LOC108359149 n=1 Tax=Rhagoletis zephyria TaxID=28612 RepID=UPI0008112FDB|nr:PREDICTED: uncharacterized protein LOC108359149 [Rhagoletis zephyria]
MVKRKWIHYLNREELLTYMAEFGLEQTGTVEELRRRFSSFIQEESNNEDYQTRFEELEAKHSKPALNVTAATPSGSQGASVMQSPMPVDAFETPQPYATYPTTSLATIMDRVRKWGFKYDGGRDPLSFIERVEELAEVYEVNRDLLPRAMPELLKEKALTWFRSNNRNWRQWEDFKRDFLRFFLNSRYHETLDDEIRRRVQQPNEKFKDYVLALQSLMRHANYTSEQKLTRIYRNSRSEFQWYVKRSEFTTLEGLVSLAEDMENIPPVREPQRAAARTTPRVTERYQHMRELPRSDETARAERTQRRPEPHSGVATPQTEYVNPWTACRHCGEDGHFARECRAARPN